MENIPASPIEMSPKIFLWNIVKVLVLMKIYVESAMDKRNVVFVVMDMPP